MAVNNFGKAGSVVPTSIGNIEITLFDGDGQGANYRVHVLDQNGSEMRVPGDIGNLVPHLTQTDINWLLNFVSRMRAKAVAEILG